MTANRHFHAHACTRTRTYFHMYVCFVLAFLGVGTCLHAPPSLALRGGGSVSDVFGNALYREADLTVRESSQARTQMAPGDTFRMETKPLKSDSQNLLQLQESASQTNGSSPQKYIILLSDKTGFTAGHLLSAAMYQFAALSEQTTTQVFSNIKSWRHVDRILSLANRIGALVCYTFTDPVMREKARNRCRELPVRCVDVLGDLLSKTSTYLGLEAAPDNLKTPAKKPLSQSYFTRIEAVDFAIRQDDGNLCKNLGRADIVLLGVGRVQKTPLSMYLAQQFGLRVANMKIILNNPLPTEVYSVEPRRVFVLKAQADYVYKVRKRRLELIIDEYGANSTKAASIKVGDGYTFNDYADLDYIKKEMEYCENITKKHSEWRVIDMTGVSVEEVADHLIIPYLPRKPTTTEAALEALSCNFFLVKADTNDIEHYDERDQLQITDKSPLSGQWNANESDSAWIQQDAWARDMKVMFVSDGLEALTGIMKGELLKKSVLRLFHNLTGTNTELSTLREVMKALFAGKERTYSVTCYRRDGTEFINEVHVTPVTDGGGEVKLFVVSMRRLEQHISHNVEDKGFSRASSTEKLDGEEEQKKKADITRRQTFYTIFDASDERMPLWYASKGFFKMTGHSVEEVLGRQKGFSVWGDFFAGGGEASTAHTQLNTLKLDQSELDEVLAVKEAMAAGQTINTCVKSYRKDGHAFWNFAHLEPVSDESGNLRYYVGSHHAVLGT